MKRITSILIVLFIFTLTTFAQDDAPTSGKEVIKSYNGFIETDFFKVKFPSKVINKESTTVNKKSFTITSDYYYVADEGNPVLKNGVKLFIIKGKELKSSSELSAKVIEAFCEYSEKKLISASIKISGLEDELMQEGANVVDVKTTENKMYMTYTVKEGEVIYKTKVFVYVKEKGKSLIYYVVFSTVPNETSDEAMNGFINGFEVKA